MNVGALFLSLFVCGLGLALAYVYWNPWGFVLDGIGFMIFVYAIKSGEAKGEHVAYEDAKSHKKRIVGEKYRCGYCMMFGKGGCKRKEELLNAEPCEDFIVSYTD